MDKLRIRVYNVRFGDAILISAPDKDQNGDTTTRHILIDVGNVLGGGGGQNVVFQPVIENVLEVLSGDPLDLYVMTHEHLDHVQGLLFAEEKVLPGESLRDKLQVRHAWLTASADPSYYDTHENAKKKKLDEALSVYKAIESFLRASPEHRTPWIKAMMLNNDPSSTNACVEYLRDLAENTWYVDRETDLTGKHTFQEAEFEIWAPEEDTAIYYTAFHPVALGVTPASDARKRPEITETIPPPGVDAGAFYNLVDMRRHGYADNLLAIDKAANNTSIVLCLKWRGWKFLFPGDAEHRSWQEMSRYIQFKPVDFLKISHHGSHNGTPELQILNQVLPDDGEIRYTALSTYPDTYNNVPDDETLAVLKKRSKLYSVEGLEDGDYIDFIFENKVTVKSSNGTDIGD